MDKLIDDPKMDVTALMKAAKRDFNIFVSLDQAYRAKWKAKKRIEGGHENQYLKVRSYYEMVKRQNNGSVAKVEVQRTIPTASVHLCKPVIGLDACHLKGPFGGQLIAIFLKLMIDILERPIDMGWVFISDRQKKGNDLKELLWLAASTYTMKEFKQHMNALKNTNQVAHDWLMKIPPNTWARSHFSCRPKRQLMKAFQEKREAPTTFTGDICPRIMEKIEEARLGATTCDVSLAGKEIFEVVIGLKNAIVDIGKISCTDRIYDLTRMPCVHKLMKGFQKKREALTAFTGDICPRIMEKIEEARLGATTCDVSLAGKEIFEVVIGVKNAIVDIGKRSCTGKIYDLTGIPCVHAAIDANKGKKSDTTANRKDKGKGKVIETGVATIDVPITYARGRDATRGVNRGRGGRR
ncbi:uncharacterized protein [Coffea arabica]|uniref:SWIM-type domain-containing protein n=1 Tax=Coffea arabica TaxID=13443 RepID=A0ABM4WML2_COFAR